MENKDLTKEYKDFLLNLKDKPLNQFLNEFKEIKDYKARETYLNEFYNKEIFNILIKKEFQDLFYLDSQAKFILKSLSLEYLDNLKTLVYCYNDNSREFNKNLEENKLKEELLNRGFKEQEPFNKEELKTLNNLKVFCVFDRDKIGLMGSFTEKQEHEGTLKFIEDRGLIAFLPKRHTKTGQLLYNKFYYKLR